MNIFIDGCVTCLPAFRFGEVILSGFENTPALVMINILSWQYIRNVHFIMRNLNSLIQKTV